VGYDRMDEYDRRAEAGPLVYKYHFGMIPLEDVPNGLVASRSGKARLQGTVV